MTGYELYTFILCLIVFILLVSLFSYTIMLIVRMRLKMIRHGLEDEEIKIEKQSAPESQVGNIISSVVSLVVCLALLIAFIFSLYMNMTEDKSPNGIPSLKVVRTSSMSVKNERNTYLEKNGLDDQIQTFDVVITHHLPAEEDLELYDIVVYEKNGTYIIHRIVGIEEPNENHPDCRHFLLQGDAVLTPDEFPVLYEQMQGIYYGERIPFVGSFVLFMQSPAGWLCILLVLASVILTPVLERLFASAIKTRRAAIIKESAEAVPQIEIQTNAPTEIIVSIEDTPPITDSADTAEMCSTEADRQ